MVEEVQTEDRPEITSQHFITGGVYAKLVKLPYPGDYIETHEHNFEHLSFLASGIVDVEALGVTTTFEAPTGISIRAGVAHKVTARAYGTAWLCIHKLPEGESDVDAIEDALVVGGTAGPVEELVIPQGTPATPADVLSDAALNTRIIETNDKVPDGGTPETPAAPAADGQPPAAPAPITDGAQAPAGDATGIESTGA